MNEIEKWLLKAENDLKVAKNEIQINEAPRDIICFHCQQAVEKYLKAYLVFMKQEFRKTHNISELLKLCFDIDKSFKELKELNVHELTIYATEVRYPDEFYIPSLEEAREAINLAEKTKEFILKKLKENNFKI
ncbi:MAG: HEPN domain-containing protein [Candidatus Goldbacteria bacterium]|nr:HEPN domain-containing protein [Candidatus Goldiibacteriota bacterium]